MGLKENVRKFVGTSALGLLLTSCRTPQNIETGGLPPLQPTPEATLTIDSLPRGVFLHYPEAQGLDQPLIQRTELPGDETLYMFNYTSEQYDLRDWGKKIMALQAFAKTSEHFDYQLPSGRTVAFRLSPVPTTMRNLFIVNDDRKPGSLPETVQGVTFRNNAESITTSIVTTTDAAVINTQACNAANAVEVGFYEEFSEEDLDEITRIGQEIVCTSMGVMLSKSTYPEYLEWAESNTLVCGPNPEQYLPVTFSQEIFDKLKGYTN